MFEAALQEPVSAYREAAPLTEFGRACMEQGGHPGVDLVDPDSGMPVTYLVIASEPKQVTLSFPFYAGGLLVDLEYKPTPTAAFMPRSVMTGSSFTIDAAVVRLMRPPGGNIRFQWCVHVEYREP